MQGGKSNEIIEQAIGVLNPKADISACSTDYIEAHPKKAGYLISVKEDMFPSKSKEM